MIPKSEKAHELVRLYWKRLRRTSTLYKEANIQLPISQTFLPTASRCPQTPTKGESPVFRTCRQ